MTARGGGNETADGAINNVIYQYVGLIIQLITIWYLASRRRNSFAFPANFLWCSMSWNSMNPPSDVAGRDWKRECKKLDHDLMTFRDIKFLMNLITNWPSFVAIPFYQKVLLLFSRAANLVGMKSWFKYSLWKLKFYLSPRPFIFRIFSLPFWLCNTSRALRNVCGTSETKSIKIYDSNETSCNMNVNKFKPEHNEMFGIVN